MPLTPDQFLASSTLITLGAQQVAIIWQLQLAASGQISVAADTHTFEGKAYDMQLCTPAAAGSAPAQVRFELRMCGR